MASKHAVSQALKELRAAYGLSPEEFAASLSAHLGSVLIPPAQLLRWEAGKGPSGKYRALLVPVLQRFKDHLTATNGVPPAPGKEE